MIVSKSSYPFEWESPSEVKTMLTYKCSVAECGNTLSHQYIGLIPDIRKHPGDGWRMVWEVWICPKHKVEVIVDGERSEWK